MRSSSQPHHFCRWVLPEEHSAEAALASVFPHRGADKAFQELDGMSPKRLRVRIGTAGQAGALGQLEECSPAP